MKFRWKGADDYMGIRLAAEEKIVRSYQCTELKIPKCTGYLEVTNKRVVFWGEARDSMIHEEVQLNTITGLSAFYGGKINFVMLLLGIGCSLFALKNFISLRQSWSPALDVFMGLVLAVAAVIVFYFCYRKTFRLKIFSSGAAGTPIAIGEGYGNVGGNTALLSLSAMPSKDTERMLLELGALVDDLQTMGDLAVEKWSLSQRDRT